MSHKSEDPELSAPARSLQLGLILAVSLHAFDELVIAIALPTIARDLGGGDWYGVTLASYILAGLVSVVWAGSSIDRRGPLRIFVVGYSLFAVGLILATLASNMWEFVAARVIQGFGGGISFTVAYAITNIVLPKDQRPRMVAWLDSAWLIPSLLAPAIGGYIVDYLNWHWVFIAQLPFVLIAGILLYPRLKPLNKTPAPGSQDSRRAIGRALRIAGGAGLFVTVIAQPVNWFWLILLPLSVALVWRPFLKVMPPGFATARVGLAAAVMLHFWLFYAFYAAELFMPLIMIEFRGLSSSVTGLAFTSCAITWVAASFFQAWLCTRVSLFYSLFLGMCITTLSVAAAASLLLPQVPYWVVYPAWAVAGVGMGISFNTVVSATMDYTREGEEGATSTANGIAGSLAIGLAAGIGGAIINHGEQAGVGFASSLGLVWVMAGIACLACFGVIWARFRGVDQPH